MKKYGQSLRNRKVDMGKKRIEDYTPIYACIHRWNQHEVGCPHRDWTKEELKSALDTAKSSEAYRIHILNHPEDTIYAGDFKGNSNNE